MAHCTNCGSGLEKYIKRMFALSSVTFKLVTEGETSITPQSIHMRLLMFLNPIYQIIQYDKIPVTTQFYM